MDTQQQFANFIEDYTVLDLEYLPSFAYYLDLIKENFFKTASRNPLHMSLSSYGDPLISLTLKRLGYPPEPRGYTVQDRNFLFTGFEVEARMLSLLLAYGFQVSNEQSTVKYNGLEGHIDALINNDTVLDIKAVKSSNFNRALPGRNQFINDKYLAQVNAYRRALELDHSGLLYYDRDTAEVYYHDTSDYDLTYHDMKLETARGVKSLEEVFEREEEFIPTPTQEVYRKSLTGNYLVPLEMVYTGYADAFYLIKDGVNGYGKPQRYVIDYRTHEETREILETWKTLYL